MVALKRKADDEAAEGDPGGSGRDFKRPATGPAAAAASTSTANRPTASNSRAMQGRNAEEGFHSLDSDEEEEYEQQKKVESLNDDDIEGQEDDTIARDGEIKITPFNLNEEQEDGYFAKDGNFIWNKKKEDESADNWLEDIDWGKVKERTAEDIKRQEEADDEEDNEQAAYNEIQCYREILSLLREKESVAKALRRLGSGPGGKRVSNAQRWKDKKKGGGDESEETKKNKEELARLSGLADAVLSRSGNMEIYEETYESIAFRLKKEDEKLGKTEIPEGMDEDDALDMFMETANKQENEAKPEATKPAEVTSEEPKAQETLWEFRWKDDEEVHGPHQTEEMLKWQESGFFDKGVFVRKVGSAGDFHDVKRVDFDLYL